MMKGDEWDTITYGSRDGRWIGFVMKLWVLCAWLLVVVSAQDHEERQRNFQKWIGEEVKKSASKLLHLRGEVSLEIPIDVDLVLIGFDGKGAFEYKLNGERLEDLLLDNYEQRRPVSRETGEKLSTTFLIDYQIVNFESDIGPSALPELEELMKTNMVRTKRPSLLAETVYPQTSFGDWNETYTIDAKDLEPKLDDVLLSDGRWMGRYLLFVQIVERALSRKKKVMGAPEWFDRNVIVIMNPSKRRMRPKTEKQEPVPDAAVFNLSQWNSLSFDLGSVIKEEGAYGYYYNYDGDGMGSTWISHKNYVVIDVSAGPVKYGQELAPSGAVSPNVLPRILDVLYEGTAPLALQKYEKNSPEFAEHIAETRDTIFRGKLAAVVASAVHHLFVNDVWINDAPDMKKIFVPLIALRNHADFNPFGHTLDHCINGTAIREELKQLVNGERVIVTESLHSLHQHKPLAVALYKSMAARSEAVVLPGRSSEDIVHARQKHYIDADVLLREFTLASDLLSAAWLDGGGKQGDRDMQRSGVQDRRITRTVPVFILSLKETPFDLAFQNNELVVSNGKIVIVLQTIGVYEHHKIEAKFTGHFLAGDPVITSTLDVQRHVLAGLTRALTGLPRPYELHDTKRDVVVQNWLWSVGHTPFGPYSGCKTLSVLAKNAALRNMLVGRLESLLHRIRSSMKTLDEFIAKYASVFENEGHGSHELRRNSNLIDVLYKRSEAFVEPPLPADVVRELEGVMQNLEGRLITLAHQFEAADFNGADETMRLLGQTVNSFEARIRNEVRRAEAKLQCCELEYKQPPMAQGSWLTYWIAAGVIVGLIFVYVSIPVFDNPDFLPSVSRTY